MKYINHYDSPIGEITIASDGENLIGLWFNKQRHDRDILENEIFSEKNLPVFENTRKWLDIYFEGKEPGFSVPLKLTGSDFRKRVGEIMLTIPYGETLTYGAIAAMIAKERNIKKMSAQAVGGAVGSNPISIIIPCHRVVGTNGSLTGYAGGIERKVWLLENEGLILKDKGYYVPTKGTAL